MSRQRLFLCTLQNSYRSRYVYPQSYDWKSLLSLQLASRVPQGWCVDYWWESSVQLMEPPGNASHWSSGCGEVYCTVVRVLFDCCGLRLTKELRMFRIHFLQLCYRPLLLCSALRCLFLSTECSFFGNFAAWEVTASNVCNGGEIGGVVRRRSRIAIISSLFCLQ